jgi:D-cysteine desulfhydrase/L-cysteate sulfo-lyase
MSCQVARVYVTSEGAALGGLLLGARTLGLAWEVIGMDWRPRQDSTVARLRSTVCEAARLLGLGGCPDESDFVIGDAGGPAYGVGRQESWMALRNAAMLEGLLVDPVYTAKGLAGMLEDLRHRPPAGDETTVFVHTGGLGAIFAYENDLRRYVIDAEVSYC